jgi:hypothetical protein
VAPQTPLLLLDNVFDTAGVNPGAVIDALSEAAGHESFRVADYRRERSWWQPATDGGGSDTFVRVGLTAAHSIDSIVLDRGHNLAGKTIYLEGSTDNAAWPVSQALNVPALNTVGGTPAAPAMCATEEGAAWTIMPATLGPRLWWRLRIPYAAGFVPVVTGIIAGLKTQLLGYSSTFDEDAGGRTQTTQQSTAGYLASDTTYSWRTAQLGLGAIGATEYDSTIRTLRAQLFERNQPTMLWMDYGTYPERGWLYTYDGAAWGMPKTRVLRAGPIALRELYPRLR